LFGEELAVLPPGAELETKEVLKSVAVAHRYLAELKAFSETIPDPAILIHTLSLQEAKDSSEIENIITTHDEMYKADVLSSGQVISSSAKEVQRYAQALQKGYQLVSQDQLLTCKHIIEIQNILEANKAGFRKLPGTELKNIKTREVIYVPPQRHQTIIHLMSNLEHYINNDNLSDVDPLVKMAIAHYQFESIHPFYDGNGRTGRIINILYLVLKDLLNIPVLYLSRYIIENKAGYYKLLQEVRDKGKWVEWVLYMLKAVEITSRQTILIIRKIRELMDGFKKIMQAEVPFYSQELLNNIFKYPYTKIEFLINDLHVNRKTAHKYLDEMTRMGLLTKHKVWRTNYYVNQSLFKLFSKPPEVN
jgi:Fic family protein